MRRQINKEEPAAAEIIETRGISVKEAGQRGGTMTRDRHGVEFYREIGARGGETTKTRWGHLFSELGKRGGRPRRPSLEQRGEEHPERKESRLAPRCSPPG